MISFPIQRPPRTINLDLSTDVPDSTSCGKDSLLSLSATTGQHPYCGTGHWWHSYPLVSRDQTSSCDGTHSSDNFPASHLFLMSLTLSSISLCVDIVSLYETRKWTLSFVIVVWQDDGLKTKKHLFNLSDCSFNVVIGNYSLSTSESNYQAAVFMNWCSE